MRGRVLFDASRLLSRTERGAPTGVDRVCLAYAEWLLSLPGVEVAPVRSKRDALVAVDPAWFADSVAEMRAKWAGAHAARALTAHEKRLFEALRAPTPPAQSVISPPPPPEDAQTRKVARPARVWRQFLNSRPLASDLAGELYFNVGHTSLNTSGILTDLAARGIGRVVMIHDLIPVTHPEFCRPGDGARHRRRVRIALAHASRILVNSRTTADEVARFAAAEGLAPPPVTVAHLGIEPVFHRNGGPADLPPYFVHVGTIEARKNLAFLLTIWRRLAERMGPDAPRLALIGRYGWENEAVLDHLSRSPAIQGLVHQASDLPDAALMELMRGARAVLAPSEVEGFDLPAVEASALGVPLIASDIGAHRELTPHARLIDPLDGPGWIKALEAATRKRPRAPGPYAAPTWDQHFDTVRRALNRRR